MDVTTLREQRKNILTQADLKIYDEILSACEHGLLRAAYLLAWIAIVESLKNKIYELAALDDARSKNIKSNIQEQEKNKNSTDKTIIGGAITCEIVPTRYESDLNYLWEQRCLYGHPYQYTPNEQDVQWIVDKALEITLARNLMYSHKRVEEFLKEELDSFHIVPLDNELRKAYILRHLKMIQEQHHPLLFKKLCFHIEEQKNQGNNNRVVYLLHFIQLLTSTKHPDLKLAAYCVDKGIANWPTTMWKVASLPSVWEALSDGQKLSLFQFFESSKGSDLSICFTAIHNLIAEGANLTQCQIDSFYNKLNDLKQSESWQYYNNRDLLLDRIEKDWISKYIWSKQGAFLDWLKGIDVKACQFDSSQIERLGTFVGTCCRSNAFVALDYVESSKDAWFTHDEFKIGIAIGLLSSNGNFSFPNNCINLTMVFAASLSDDVQEIVCKKLQVLPFASTNIMIEKQTELKEILVANDDKLNKNLKDLLIERIQGCFVRNTSSVDISGENLKD